MSETVDAWKVSEKDFPHKGSAAEKLAFCLRYAVLAPSVYNTQPWFFAVAGDTVSIYIDRRYGLAVADPEDRQALMACAGALAALRLAVRYFGYEDTLKLFPHGEDDDLLAQLRLGEKTIIPPEESEARLFRAVPKRHTDRGPFADRDPDADSLQNLKQAAFREGAGLHVCGQADRRVLLRLIAEADHIQYASRPFRRELALWTDPRRADSGDGIAGYGLQYPEVTGLLAPSVARRFEGGLTDEQLDKGTPALAILSSRPGGKLETLQAGLALMRVLLQAEVEGLAVTQLNQPCEVPEIRLRVQDHFGSQLTGRAQAILRIGYGGGAPVYTPRRPLGAALRIDGGGPGPVLSGRAGAHKSRKNFFRKLGRLFQR
jgi:hypothetical protein